MVRQVLSTFKFVGREKPVEKSIAVLSPNRGEKWVKGNTYQVRWKSKGIDKVRIYIFNPNIAGSGSINYIVPNNQPISASQGYYNWTIGEVALPPGVGKGPGYKILIDDVDSNISDESDNFFSINEAPSIFRFLQPEEETAISLLNEALQTAKDIESAFDRSEALGIVAEGMAKAGMKEQAKSVFEQALKTARWIKRRDDRAWALMDISIKMAKVGMEEKPKTLLFKQALHIEDFPDVYWQSEGFRELVKEMAKAGQFEQALQIAKKIGNVCIQSEAFAKIAIIMLEKEFEK